MNSKNNKKKLFSYDDYAKDDFWFSSQKPFTHKKEVVITNIKIIENEKS